MATITRYRKRDGAYSYTAQIRIRRGGQIVYSESFTNPKKSAVQAWAKKRETELAEPGALDALQHRGVTVGSVLSWFERFHGDEMGRTQSTTVRALQRSSLADLDAIALTAADVIDFAQDRRKGAGPATVLQDIVWLRIALRQYRLATGGPVALQAIEDASDVLHKARIIGRGKSRERRPSLAELDLLLDYFAERDSRSSKIPMVDIVLYALFSSRRLAEICRPTWSDLEPEAHTLMVRDMKHPRGVRDTRVFLTDEALAILLRQPRSTEGEKRFFPYNHKTVSSIFTGACHFLEIEDLHFHDLRHECVSWLFELGWDIPRVAGVSGHQSWASLQRYTHLRSRGIYDKYEGWRWRPKIKTTSSSADDA